MANSFNALESLHEYSTPQYFFIKFSMNIKNLKKKRHFYTEMTFLFFIKLILPLIFLEVRLLDVRFL
jgi:hypothetical protein